MTGLVIILLAGALYFLPTIVGRSKHNAGAIFVLNLLLGWTLVGWVVALVWALTVEPPLVQVIHTAPLPGPFCSGCGANLPAGSRFCANCGRRTAA